MNEEIMPHRLKTLDHGVIVLSAGEAGKFWPPSQSVMLRIDGEGQFHPIRHIGRYRAIKEQVFGDYASKEEAAKFTNPDGGELITNIQGKEIADLIMSIKDDELFVVHCFAGISRSAAVAVCFARWRQDKVLEAMLYSSNYYPNILVISSIIKHFPGSYESQKEN